MRYRMSVTESLIRGNFFTIPFACTVLTWLCQHGNKLRMNSTVLRMKILLHAFIRPLCFKAKSMLLYTTIF